MTKDIYLKKLKAGDLSDFEALIDLFGEVFNMTAFSTPRREYLQGLLRQDGYHVFTALNMDEVVGGLVAYTLDQCYSEKPFAYIFDLAVAKQWQRQGIGSALIAEARAYFKQLGYAEVFVQADRIDDYAVDFYRKTGPTAEEDVVHFYYSLEG